MIPSPLQLEHYFFTQMHLDAHPGADPDAEMHFDSSVQCGRHEDDPRRWMITLTVVIGGEEEDADPAYTGQFEIIGMFRVDDQFPEDKVANLAHANGAAVLYGSVRELVANLTARGPFPQVLLPTTTFIDECAHSKDKANKGTE